MWRQTHAVFVKEWRDALRDRRSLVSALAYAVIGPLLVVAALLALARSDEAGRRLTLAVAGGEGAPSLVAFLEQHRVRVLPEPADVRHALERGEIDAAIRVDADFAERFTAARPARVGLEYDGSSAAGRRALPRVRALLDEYAAQTASARLVVRGVVPSVARPLRIEGRDVATGASRAALALAALPIFLLLAPFITSMNLAIDVTAGERERHSLEPLLAHPVRPAALALGKWLPGIVLSVAGTAATLVILQVALRSGLFQVSEVPVGLTWTEATLLLAVLIPLAAFAPAVQMLVSMFSRSYKEAQTYLSLLLFLPMIPGFLFAFGAARPVPWMSAAPLVGQQLLMERVLRGDPPEASGWALLAAATLVPALGAVALTARLLTDERIVLGP